MNSKRARVERQVLRTATLWIVLGLAGCNTIAGIWEGSAREGLACSTPADCVSDLPECRSAVACEEGLCVFIDASEGTPLEAQTLGDCTAIVCDGSGRTDLIPAPVDVEDDGNPCTEDACSGTTPVHTPLESVLCYTGPPGTRGVGNCKDGTLQCDEQGNPTGACQGEVLPGIETCLFPADEDCDGETNENGAGCVCEPGGTMPCYTGETYTHGAGNCHDGTAICGGDGLGYGMCQGEQLPMAETCDAGNVDEDCDGNVNESGANCFCGDGQVSPALGEACDDGNANPDDGCTPLCVPTGCGDGIVDPGLGEQCDDGDQDSSDGCTTWCRLPVCGDWFLQPGESCDDGNTIGGDTCPSNCQLSVVSMGMGTRHTCVILEQGILKCWGNNDYGELGLGDTLTRGDEPGEMALPAVDLGFEERAVAVAGGTCHTCALLESGSVKCWGANDYGQLGYGNTHALGDGPGEMGDALPPVDLGAGRTAVAISAETDHTCAVLDNGTVKCWGRNGCGQLGQGDFTQRGDNPGEMGDDLPPIDLGTGVKAVAVAATNCGACALLLGGTVKCWGNNDNGMLGQGDTMWRGENPGDMGDALPAVDLGTDKIAIAMTARFHHVCALLDGGSIKCWGLNNAGQLGLGNTVNRGNAPGQMGDDLQEVNLGTGRTALRVASGWYHNCAELDDGSLRCWGANSLGELGLGHNVQIGDVDAEMGDALLAVDLGAASSVAVIAGPAHTCALLGDGHTKCWGSNERGQLGLGDAQNRGDQPGEMGGNLPAVVP